MPDAAAIRAVAVLLADAEMDRDALRVWFDANCR